VIVAAAPTNGDVLAAASLLLAIVAVLLSLWYADIDAALRVEIRTHLEDAGPQRRQVGAAIKTRAAPLAGGALVLLLVFVPEATHLAVHWIRHAYNHGFWHAVKTYDSVELSIVVIVVFLATLTAYTVWLMVELIDLRQRLKLPKSR
jgi:hypothetical protein